jgi:peptidoglycan-associated lipoprotein
MKLAKLTILLALAVGAASISTGCKTKHPPVTKVGPGGTGTDASPGTGGKLGTGSTEGLSSTTGIPANAPGAHAGWIPNAEALAGDTVHFDYDSAVVKPGEQSKLAAVAEYLKSNSANAVNIEGHCDERGTEEYNRALGDRRAQALREELAKSGIDASRVDTVSFGKDRPADSAHDEGAWKQNRRGVFIVLSPPK